MGNGLIRATLATIATRGPWLGESDLDNRPWTLSGADVVAFYEAIRNADTAPYAVLGKTGFSSRKVDRALQILKKADLIHFDAVERQWKLGPKEPVAPESSRGK